MEDKDNRQEKKAGMPPLPPGFMKPAMPMQPPPFPGAAGKPGLPPFLGGGTSAPSLPQPQGLPSPAPFPAQPPSRDSSADESGRMREEKDKLEKKIAEMEKVVSQEKEKALLAALKNQQDEALSSRVESSLKDIQEKLRRDRHEQEVQEERMALKAKVKELEARLVSERETWMQTLKTQMQERETQSKDVEGHFIYRLQEMERRWLDEKAQWQKEIALKEDEARALKHGAERQKELEDELRRSALEKEMQAKETSKLREEIAKLERDKASVESYIKNMPEREREFSDLKVENAVLRAREEKARDEIKLAEERFRRDAEAMQKEIGRLQSDIGTLSDRKNAEKDEEIRKAQARHQAEIQEKEKTLAEISGEKIRAISELLKLKGLLSRVQAINAVLEKERQGLRLEKMQMAQAMAANIEDAKKYKSEVEALRAAHQSEFQKFRNEYAANAGAEHAAKVSEIETRCQAELMAAARKHQDDLAKVRAEAALDLENKIIEMRAKYEEGASKLSAGVRKALETEHAAEIARLKEALAAAEDEKAALRAEARRGAEESSEFNERLARAQKEFEDSRTALAADYRRLEAQLESVTGLKAENERNYAAGVASLKAQLSEFQAAASAREQELAGALRSSQEKSAALEAELAAMRQRTAELDEQLRDLAVQLETERQNSSALRDEAAGQSRADQERLAAVSAELESYKRMEGSIPDRIKWAIKGKK